MGKVNEWWQKMNYQSSVFMGYINFENLIYASSNEQVWDFLNLALTALNELWTTFLINKKISSHLLITKILITYCLFTKILFNII